MKEYYTNCNVKIPRKLEIVRNVFAQIELENDAKILDIGGVSSYYGILKAIFQSKDVYLSNINFMDIEDVKNSICCDATRLPFKNETWNVITSFDLIEHLINPDDFLAESFRVLKRGGWFVISTPNLADLYSRIVFLLGYTPYSYNPSKFRVAIPFQKTNTNAGHKSVFTYSGLKQLLGIHGFRIIHSNGYHYCNEMKRSERSVGFINIRRQLNLILTKSLKEGQLFICKK
ncbi:MAG: class I SAM-dependent methyltransferase [Halobacteriota archaeon]